MKDCLKKLNITHNWFLVLLTIDWTLPNGGHQNGSKYQKILFIGGHMHWLIGCAKSVQSAKRFFQAFALWIWVKEMHLILCKNVLMVTKLNHTYLYMNTDSLLQMCLKCTLIVNVWEIPCIEWSGYFQCPHQCMWIHA